jgi:catalase
MGGVISLRTNGPNSAKAGDKNLSKESSTAQDKSLPKHPAGNSTRKDKDLATATTNDKEPMTTNQGQPISTDQNSLRIGHRGPTLMEDQVLRKEDPALRSRADSRAGGARAGCSGTRYLPGIRRLLQILPEEDEMKFDFDILDPTKIIPEDLIPVQRVGRMVLNRNPDNYFAETEQVAFMTSNVVPGIDFSNDPLLQGRNFSYNDTQLSRLGGPNFHEIPINRPVCPFSNNQRDAHMRITINKGRVSYAPSSLMAIRLRKSGPKPVSSAIRRRSHRAQNSGAQPEFRGPLRPSNSFLEQPDRGGEAAHR